MNITIFGSGYVGLVTATCFAEVGNHVTCVDIDNDRVNRLSQGECLIYEPGLEALLKANLKNQRLSFTSKAVEAIQKSDIIFIAVGTPPKENGSADLSYVYNVARTIGQHVEQTTIVINKSTVPVGTADAVNKIIQQQLSQRDVKLNVVVASNPEFLKEGHAVTDFMKPDRVIIGVSDDYAKQRLQELYQPFNRNHDKLLCMDPRSAELTKYAANAMLATKISFMNELSQIAEKMDADIEQVRKGIGSDPRIGFQFIYPGCGYGGSCFPKDVQALIHTANQAGARADLITATHQTNLRQKQVLVNKIIDQYGDDLKGKRFALWGLAFKPNTDDMREAPSLSIIDALTQRGATVCAYDPQAIPTAQGMRGHNPLLEFANNAYDCLHQANALIIVTEWLEFRSPDFFCIKEHLKDNIIFDGRNLYQTEIVTQYGLSYVCIGKAPHACKREDDAVLA